MTGTLGQAHWGDRGASPAPCSPCLTPPAPQMGPGRAAGPPSQPHSSPRERPTAVSPCPHPTPATGPILGTPLGVPRSQVKVAQTRGKRVYFGQGVGGHCPVRGNWETQAGLAWGGEGGHQLFGVLEPPGSHPLQVRGLSLQLWVAGGVRRVVGVPWGLTPPRCPPGGGTCSPGDSCLAMHMPRAGWGGREGGSAWCCCSWGLPLSLSLSPAVPRGADAL